MINKIIIGIKFGIKNSGVQGNATGEIKFVKQDNKRG